MKREVKKHSEGDYFILKNSLLGELRKRELIDYPEMITNLLINYTPESDNININNLITSLLKLPETHNFDNQFTAVPDKFKKTSEEIFTINDNIELKIKGYIDRNKIKIQRGTDGRMYVSIETDNKKLIDVFDSK